MSTLAGAHAMIFSPRAEALRSFFKEKLRLRSVDAGGGWLIFALPPSEVAFHPGKKGQVLLYFLCANVNATVKELKRRGVAFAGGINKHDWGKLVHARLPDATTLGIYEPTHASPLRRRRKRT